MLIYAILFVILVVGVPALAIVAARPLHDLGDGPGPVRPGAAAGFTRAFQAIGGSLTREHQDWKRYVVAMLVFNVVIVHRDLRDPGAAAASAAQSRRHGRHAGRHVLQHRRFVRDQHQPAALLRRSVAELLLAALRADVAAVRVGGDRHRRAGGARARPRRPAEHGQLLRRPAARLVPGAAAGRAGRRDAHGARRHADDLRRLRRRDDTRGRPADDRPRAGGGLRRHQAARHQRRRLLRAEQHASVREPELLDQRALHDQHHPHPDGVRVDVRPDRRAHAPRRRRLRRDARAGADQDRRSRSISRPPRPRPSPSCRGAGHGNLEGKELRFGAERRPGLGGDDHLAPATARSTPCTTA